MFFFLDFWLGLGNTFSLGHWTLKTIKISLDWWGHDFCFLTWAAYRKNFHILKQSKRGTVANQSWSAMGVVLYYQNWKPWIIWEIFLFSLQMTITREGVSPEYSFLGKKWTFAWDIVKSATKLVHSVALPRNTHHRRRENAFYQTHTNCGKKEGELADQLTYIENCIDHFTKLVTHWSASIRQALEF